MATNNSLKIQVDGLKDLQRELRQLDSTLPRKLRLAHKSVADVIADEARGSFAGRSDVASEVPAAVRSGAEQQGASVILNGAKAPMIFGAEFGGGAHGAGHPTSGGGHTTQFKPWRGNGRDAGYSLFPTIRHNHDRIIEMYGDALDEVTKAAFPN